MSKNGNTVLQHMQMNTWESTQNRKNSKKKKKVWTHNRSGLKRCITAEFYETEIRTKDHTWCCSRHTCINLIPTLLHLPRTEFPTLSDGRKVPMTNLAQARSSLDPMDYQRSLSGWHFPTADQPLCPCAGVMFWACDYGPTFSSTLR